MATSLLLEPGYTYDTSERTRLLIKKTGIEQLPDGVYTFWIQDYYQYSTVIDILYNETVVTIENGIATIDYPDVEPTTSNSLGNNVKLAFCLGLAPIVYLKKKRSKRKY